MHITSPQKYTVQQIVLSIMQTKPVFKEMHQVSGEALNNQRPKKIN